MVTLEAEPNAGVNVLFVDDLSFGESYQFNEKSNNINILETFGYDYSLKNMQPILENADYVIANLETPITDKNHPPLSSQQKNICIGVIQPIHHKH